MRFLLPTHHVYSEPVNPSVVVYTYLQLCVVGRGGETVVLGQLVLARDKERRWLLNPWPVMFVEVVHGIQTAGQTVVCAPSQYKCT